MTDKRLYLDVDGVVNVVRPQPPPTWPDWQRHHVDGFPILTSPTMLSRLLALPLDEIVWATTWEDRADRSLAPVIGLPTGWRHLPLHTSKADAVLDDLRENPVERFVWVDDAVVDPKVVDAVSSRSGATGLGISPALDEGLTPAHLDRVEAFLNGDATS